MNYLWEWLENLIKISKELENITKSSIYSRGNSILIKSDIKKNELVKNAIQFLVISL